MDRTVIHPMVRAAILACIVVVAAPFGAAAHQMVVFASANCDAVTVEAKFSNGNLVHIADVRVLDGENNLLLTQPIAKDGTLTIPLDKVDHAGGLVIEVETGSHDNYWIITPDDIARSCQG